MMLSVRSVSKALAIELAAQAPLFDKDGLSIAMSPECWRLNSVVGENVIDWRSFGYVEGDQRGGRAWISAAVLPDGTPVLRACITNYRSTEDDVKSFVDDLGRG